MVQIVISEREIWGTVTEEVMGRMVILDGQSFGRRPAPFSDGSLGRLVGIEPTTS